MSPPDRASAPRPAPLTDIRVIDITQVLAGPYCTYQLALLGAEVIKIEPPGGEWARHGGPNSQLTSEGLGSVFCVQNSDKQFVELDLKTDAGRDAVLDLVRSADVLVENSRPGVMDRLGLGAADAMEANPTLVYCSISAYGADGPLGGRPAYDHVVQSMSGIMETTGPAGSEPTKVGAPYVDYATGLNGSLAVLAALRERDRTGEGQVVDVTMLDTALGLMASNLSHVATTGVDLPKLGNDAASGSPSSGCFDAADGHRVMIAANTERQFSDFCAALGHPEWATDSRWATLPDRRRNQAELRALVEAEIATAPADHWEQAFVDAGVPASRVRRLSEVIAEGQPEARGLLHELAVGETAVPLQLPGAGFRLNGHSLNPTTPPRPVGSDNAKWIPEEK